jgi:hypothetical protein
MDVDLPLGRDLAARGLHPLDLQPGLAQPFAADALGSAWSE